MPLISTLGAASSRGFGQFAQSGASVKYIEDYFSTYLYTGSGFTQTIGNNIALSDTASWYTVKLRENSGLGRSVSIDSTGNVYVAGTSNDGTNYILLAKYDSSGSLQWQRKIRQNASSSGRVSVDGSGNVYVVGIANNGTSNYAALLKYDTSGSLQWQRKLSHASTSTFTPNGMAVDSSSNVYVIGTYDTSTYSVVAKYNSSGTIQWQRRFNVGAVTQSGYGVSVDSSLNVYTVGNNAGFSINKYNSSGAIQWQRVLDSSNGDGRAVTVDSSDNIYVVGKGDSSAKILLAKYNTSGVIQWQRTLIDATYSGSYGNAITTDSSGNIYITGILQDSASLVYTIVAKYNSSGTIQWQRKIFTPGVSSNGFGIKADSSGNVYSVGQSNDGVSYFYIVKLAQDGTTLSGNAFVTMIPGSATSATSTLSEGANSGTDAAGPAVDAAGTATDSAGAATSSIATQSSITGTGGLVWIKSRSAATDHALYDTARGATFDLVSNSTAAQTTQTTGLTSFTASGFNIGSLAKINTSSATYASWTWRKAPKFFDVVTYTGNGSSNRQINHNLESVPGMIIFKCTSTGATNWAVYHRGLNGGVNPQNFAIYLNLSVAQGGGRWASTAPTSTQFTVNNDDSVNTNGDTYVAYLFAHDAGGFGLDGTQNVISCGSVTTNSSGVATVNLGYEPQFVLIKTVSTGGWVMLDSMRGNAALNGTTNTEALLSANTAGAESQSYGYANPLATGFQLSGWGATPQTFIYMAIRRGPMKVPTDATTVFRPVVQTPSGLTTVTSGFVTDTVIQAQRNRSATTSTWVTDRLRGNTPLLRTNATASENTALGTDPVYYNASNANTGFQDDFFVSQLGVSTSSIYWMFRRAPQVYDSVCYSGSGSNTTISHNLGIAPEMMIVKCRNSGLDWWAYHSALGNTKYMIFNGAGAPQTSSTAWNNTTPTASVFSVGTGSQVNASGNTYVAYLFATCAGVSKVGSYTGNGGTQTISCGFSGGARFVMIKNATASNTDNWWIWDTARGMISGNDLRITPNDITAEQNYDDVFTTTGGFQVTAGTSSINNNGGTYIFLAIA